MFKFQIHHSTSSPILRKIFHMGPVLNCSTANWCPDIAKGWQKFREGVKGLHRRVWTWTKTLSPNMRYFVVISRFVAINTLLGRLWAKSAFFWSQQCFLGMKCLTKICFGIFALAERLPTSATLPPFHRARNTFDDFLQIRVKNWTHFQQMLTAATVFSPAIDSSDSFCRSRGGGGVTRRGHLLLFKTTCLKVFYQTRVRSLFTLVTN